MNKRYFIRILSLTMPLVFLSAALSNDINSLFLEREVFPRIPKDLDFILSAKGSYLFDTGNFSTSIIGIPVKADERKRVKKLSEIKLLENETKDKFIFTKWAYITVLQGNDILYRIILNDDCIVNDKVKNIKLADFLKEEKLE
jgi:hypothetical protein